jgi:hypothetical protein
VFPVLKSADAARAVTRVESSAPPSPSASGLTRRIYAAMGLTTFTTFATLVTIHQLFFMYSVFA